MSKEVEELKSNLLLRARSVEDLISKEDDKLKCIVEEMRKFAEKCNDEEDLVSGTIFYAGSLRAAARKYYGSSETDITLLSKLLLKDVGREELIQNYY